MLVGSQRSLGRKGTRPVSFALTTLAFTDALVAAGIAGSIGTVGDALDNALMESTVIWSPLSPVFDVADEAV